MRAEDAGAVGDRQAPSRRAGALAILPQNAIAHFLGSILTGTYSPGLVTGLAVYVPLAYIALLRAEYQAERRTLRVGVATGLVVHGLVFAMALALTRAL